MPKAELHLHLDGSLRIETALELARTRGVEAPRDVEGMRRELVAPMPCRDQAELLRAFDLPIALMQDAEALERITAELVEAKAAEGVRYVEIRWGPLLHTARGLSLADGIAAVSRGSAGARGEPASVVRLICTALRSHDPAATSTLAGAAPRFRRRRTDRLGLAGPEAAFPDPARSTPGVRRRPRGGLADHASTPASGAARAQVRRALGGRPGADRPRPGRDRRPDLCAELTARGDRARPLPDARTVQAGIVPSRRRPPARAPPPARACRSRSRPTTRPSPTSR